MGLTLAFESGTTRRMGRPPIKKNVPTVLTTLRLPADMAGRIDERAGPNKRAQWIRELIARELRKEPK